MEKTLLNTVSSYFEQPVEPQIIKFVEKHQEYILK